MKHHKTILATMAFVFLASACGKAESHAEEVETTSDPQMELTEAQVLAMGTGAAAQRRAKQLQDNSDDASKTPPDQNATGGMTQQQYDQAMADMIASGMTKDQAEMVLAMGAAASSGSSDGMKQIGAIAAANSGTPGNVVEDATEALAAMGLRDKTSNEGIEDSKVSLQYDGVDYLLQIVSPDVCKDSRGQDMMGFDRSPDGFIARTSPNVEGGPTLKFGGDSGWYGFAFWLDFDPEIGSERGFERGFDVVDNRTFGVSIRSDDERLSVEKSRLSYDGPITWFPGGDTTSQNVSIEATFCPD